MEHAFSDQMLAKAPPPPTMDEGMARIYELMQDPGVDPFALIHLITLEIHKLTSELVRLRHEPTAACILKNCAAAIAALREERQSIIDMMIFRQKRDTLNLDSEQAKHLIKTLDHWFGTAMKNNGLDDEFRNRVMREYRDLSIEGEPLLRREVEKINSKEPRK